MDGQRILVAEDDTDLRNMLRFLLEQEGYGVLPAADGAAALLLAARERPDLVILDVLMPHADGWEVLSQLRRFSDAPVLMLTALAQPGDRVKGFELGADDYLPKPFYAPELVMRVRALLRRARVTAPVAGDGPPSPVPVPTPFPLAEPARLQFPGLTIDLGAGRVNGEELPPMEFRLLVTLAREPKRVFSREELGERVWGQRAGFDHRTIHTHVKRLRERLETGTYRYIHTVWGVGYRFEVEATK
ncbi:MAG: response regulator transcription factor [Bacillota bacterium]